MQGYGQIVRPLTEQLKKDCFRWNEAASQAFHKLKEAMTRVPILAMLDFSKPFIIEANASGFAIRVVLMQNDQPMAYYNQDLSHRASLKSAYEKDLMAIVLVVTKWRSYLLGRRFVIRIDQKSLKFLLEQCVIEAEYQRWVCKLLGFDFEIQYKAGKLNQAANALSRRLDLVECASLVIP